MSLPFKYDFLNKNVENLAGVGPKIKNLLKKKNIEKISDLLWDFPHSNTDRSKLVTLDSLEVGKVATIKVKVSKYNFPRIRNLPNRVVCEDNKGKIDIIFFNSREGYIRKILPLNGIVIISGKVNYFKNKYQITNPPYVVPQSKQDYVNKIIPKYSLTEGLNEKAYRKLVEQVLFKIKKIDEWHTGEILKKIGNARWDESLHYLHKAEKIDFNSKYYRRLAYDEVLATLLVMSSIRKRLKSLKKRKRKYKKNLSTVLIKNFNLPLTGDQKKVIMEIDNDLKSEYRMFRILQGDVGSGKTIVSLIAAANVIESNYQVVLMAPTEILAKQHFNLAKKVFKSTNIVKFRKNIYN